MLAMETTVYYFKDGEWSDSTHTFPFKTETSLQSYLTSLYGKKNMDNVFWDIWQEPEDEGLEEIEYDQDSEIGSYLKKKMWRKKNGKT